MEFLKDKRLWAFAAGIFVATKGKDMVTSEKAKHMYAEVVAKGMIASDDVKVAYEDIKEEALDIKEEAKEIKANKLLEGSND